MAGFITGGVPVCFQADPVFARRPSGWSGTGMGIISQSLHVAVRGVARNFAAGPYDILISGLPMTLSNGRSNTFRRAVAQHAG